MLRKAPPSFTPKLRFCPCESSLTNQNNSSISLWAPRSGPNTISVIVPTYRRPISLYHCLVSLNGQLRAPDEIVVVCRQDDIETLAIIDETVCLKLPILAIHPTESGVVAAYNAGIEAASGFIVAFIDDDAMAAPDWLSRIESHFAADLTAGGLGGRDRVYHNDEPILGRRKRVGVVQWFGRVIGNHHLGFGPPREVDVLKGVNMSFRRSALAGLRFDDRLLGEGAQSDCELAFCLELRRRGVKLIYDPAILVHHFPAERPDSDARVAQNVQSQINQAYNETITLLEHLRSNVRLVFMAWAVFVGTRRAPGLLQGLRLPFLVPKKPFHFVFVSIEGRIMAWQTWRKRRANV